jgi:hypothetical protein
MHHFVPIEENSQLNNYDFNNDGKKVRLLTSNNNTNGKIYSNLNVVEANLCINLLRKNFQNMINNLIRNSNYNKTCKTILSYDWQT